MSCRTSAAGSLATTFIQRAYGLQDAQCTALFHELRRTARTGAITADPDLYRASVVGMHARISSDDRWTPGMRARALARVQRALHDTPADTEIRAAAAHLAARADRARRALDTEFASAATACGQPGVTPAMIAAEFDRLYREGVPAGLTVPPIVNRDLPPDANTRWAIHVLRTGGRCATCGQFTARTQHICPGPATAPAPAPARRSRPSAPAPAAPDFVLADPQPFVNLPAPDPVPTDVPASPVTVPVVAPQAGGLTLDATGAWDMDEFQAVYDQARAAIEDGPARVPTSAEAEAVPGAVTSGLGARDGGTPFGLELELDFPDDAYPYTARQQFAQQLYDEGIVVTPHVARWHFVGAEGQDRPGGEYDALEGRWVCEFDRSVDDADGERGVEIKSGILYDEPETWRQIHRITEVARALGGRATVRTGLHVNVDGAGYEPDDVTTHTNLMRLADAFDDTLIRLAHNPESASQHRGRGYCERAHVPPDGYRDVNQARAYANHYQAFNLSHLPGPHDPRTANDRIEVRIWDATLDPGRIQAAVTVSLGIVKAARDGITPGQGAEPAGTHRSTYGNRRLSGQDWTDATASMRRLTGVLSQVGVTGKHQVAQLVHAFAGSRWAAR